MLNMSKNKLNLILLLICKFYLERKYGETYYYNHTNNPNVPCA